MSKVTIEKYAEALASMLRKFHSIEAITLWDMHARFPETRTLYLAMLDMAGVEDSDDAYFMFADFQDGCMDVETFVEELVKLRDV